MKWRFAALGFVVVIVAVGAAWAQESTRVTVGGTDMVVVREDGVVRLGPGGVVTVSGDWRKAAPKVAVGDASAILVDLGASEEGGRMSLHLAGDVLFDFGSSAVRPDAAVALAKVAQVIRQRSVGRVDLLGHTDSIGTDAANQTLSEARALAVMQWLNAREGIPAEIMAARGLGSRQPVAYNTMPDGSDNPEGRARNRRVEVQFATTEAAAQAQTGGTAIRVGDRSVAVGGDAIQADGSGVSLGGGAIRVDATGVQIGGMGGQSPSAQSGAGHAPDASDETSMMCAGGHTCRYVCTEGACTMTCAGGAHCTYSCPGGDCRMTCAGGAVCSFSCPGGGCQFVCAEGSACTKSCPGGGCTCSGPDC